MVKSSVSMKLLIDTHAKRVLFAEAGKDCVDFLFYILSLPVAKLIDLVGKQQMVGSLANLYKSLEKLNKSYVLTNKTKDAVLNPVIISPVCAVSSVPLLALNDAPNTAEKEFYTCNQKSRRNVADAPETICPNCCSTMKKALSYVARSPVKESSEEGGFVKGVVTYMVMDDLMVKPMSNISSITLLNKFKVKDVGALQEKVVYLEKTEAVKLLKASLETDKVLTKVFLNRKKRARRVR